MTDLLEVKDLRTEFFTERKSTTVVDGVSFYVSRGEVLALVGESGCGKSVTALSLMGLLPRPLASVTRGSIHFDDRDIARLGARDYRSLRGREIAIISQDPMASLNPVMTIGQQISEPLQIHLKFSRAAAAARAIELLSLVGIPSPAKRLNDYPHQLSGGMRQRVMIAMALACSPKLILADEITTALDVTIQAQVLELLKKIAAELNTACILITHDLGIVAGMAERVHVMYGGRIVEKARTEELFANPRMPYTWGLLHSVPRIDQVKERLQAIDGFPPNLQDPPAGCRFAPRCVFSKDICTRVEPPLSAVAGSGHEARCWGTQNVPEGGWLIDFAAARNKQPTADPPPTVPPYRAGSAPPAAAKIACMTGHKGSQVPQSKLVETFDLRVEYSIGNRLIGRGRSVLRALDGVDLMVNKGETLGLVGESGCGKSTLGRAILQLTPPTSGSVRFDGLELTNLAHSAMRAMRRRMQMIFQDPYASLNPRMKVREIVGEPLIIHGLATGSALDERIAALLKTVGMDPSFADRYPHEFSGGQRQRIGIARALAVDPEFIVADEAVSALDVSIQAQVINLLQDLQASLNLTYLFIAHDLAVVKHIADRVAVMYLGRIVEIAHGEDLYRRPLHPYTTALMSAVPVPDPKYEAGRKRMLLQGEVPSALAVPTGCRFRTRCWKAQPLCAEADPHLTVQATGHSVACHFPNA